MLFLTWKKKIGKPFFQGYHYFLFRKGLVPRPTESLANKLGDK